MKWILGPLHDTYYKGYLFKSHATFYRNLEFSAYKITYFRHLLTNNTVSMWLVLFVKNNGTTSLILHFIINASDLAFVERNYCPCTRCSVVCMKEGVELFAKFATGNERSNRWHFLSKVSCYVANHWMALMESLVVSLSAVDI